MSKRSEIFDPRRFGLTMWWDMRGRVNSVLIGIGAAIGIFLIISLIDIWSNSAEPGFHHGMFTAVLVIGGLIVTGNIFRDLHRKETIGGYLLLPASALEKVVVRILLAGIGWALFTVIWYTLFSLLAEGVNSMIFGRSHSLFNPLEGDVWLSIAHYLVLHSIFLVGAVYFRKHHLLKTILSLFVAGMVISILGLVAVRLAFWDYFQTAFHLSVDEHLGPVIERLVAESNGIFEVLRWIARIVYWAVLPVLCWVFTYVRFREVEVHHGV